MLRQQQGSSEPTTETITQDVSDQFGRPKQISSDDSCRLQMYPQVYMSSNMQGNSLFTKEVDKLVVAPYQVSLKRLDQILKHTSIDDLYIWSLTKTCQIRPLVTRVLQSSSIDEYARSVLYSLVRAERIRDDILLHQPSTLDEVFFLPGDNYVRMDENLILFNTPLPKTISLPQNAVRFLEHALSNGSNIPPQDWIRQLQMVLRSSGPEILESVDEAVIDSCSSCWNSILKTNQNFEFLCCLEIACILQQYSTDVNASYCSFVCTNTECRAIRRWIAKACSLLEHKTERLIRSLLLRALYFVSDKPDVTTDHAIEAAAMIKSILGCVDCLVIQSTIQEKENFEALSKLTNKVNQLERSPLLQMAMLNVIQIFDPASHPLQISTHESLNKSLTLIPSPNSVIQQHCYVDILRTCLKIRSNVEQSLSSMSTELPHEPEFFKNCLEYAINQCVPTRHGSVSKVLQLEQASLLVQAMSQAVRSCENTDLARCVLSIKIPEWWSIGFATPQNPQNCAFLEICPHNLEIRRQHITLEITNLIMQISCLYGFPLSRYNYEQLSYRISQAINQTNSYICSFITLGGQKLSNHALINQSTQCVPDLDQELAMLHAKTSEMIQNHVNLTCKDLQDRCDNIEEPLRLARSDIERLEKDLIQSKQDAKIAAASHQDECANLQDKINELEHEIEAAQHNSETVRKQQTLDLAKWKAEMETLQNSKIMLEEKIANLQRQEAELRDLVKAKDEAIHQIRSEADACASTRDILHLELSEAREKEKRLMSVLFESKAI